MKTFEQWLTERGLRTSLSGLYPPQVGAGQYVVGYAMATSPAALAYYVNRERKKNKKKRKRKH